MFKISLDDLKNKIFNKSHSRGTVASISIKSKHGNEGHMYVIKGVDGVFFSKIYSINYTSNVIKSKGVRLNPLTGKVSFYCKSYCSSSKEHKAFFSLNHDIIIFDGLGLNYIDPSQEKRARQILTAFHINPPEEDFDDVFEVLHQDGVINFKMLNNKTAICDTNERYDISMIVVDYIKDEFITVDDVIRDSLPYKKFFGSGHFHKIFSTHNYCSNVRVELAKKHIKENKIKDILATDDIPKRIKEILCDKYDGGEEVKGIKFNMLHKNLSKEFDFDVETTLIKKCIRNCGFNLKEIYHPKEDTILDYAIIPNLTIH